MRDPDAIFELGTFMGALEAFGEEAYVEKKKEVISVFRINFQKLASRLGTGARMPVLG